MKTIHCECSDKLQLISFGVRIDVEVRLLNRFLKRNMQEEEISRALSSGPELIKVDDVCTATVLNKRWCRWGHIYADPCICGETNKEQ